MARRTMGDTVHAYDSASILNPSALARIPDAG